MCSDSDSRIERSIFTTRRDCQVCDGSGKRGIFGRPGLGLVKKKCGFCGSDGKVRVTKQLVVVGSDDLQPRPVSEHLRSDRAFVLVAVAEAPETLEYASPALRGDRVVVLAAVTVDGMALVHADPVLRDNKQVVLAAAKQNIKSFEHASKGMRESRDVVVSAAIFDLGALAYASNSDAILDMVSVHHSAFTYAPPSRLVDHAFFLSAVKRNGLVLQHGTPAFKADQEIVLAAATQIESAMGYAAPELTTDRDFMMAAVKNNGRLLRYASRDLRADRAIALAAAARDGDTLRYVDPDVLLDVALEKELASNRRGASSRAVAKPRPASRRFSGAAVG